VLFQPASTLILVHCGSCVTRNLRDPRVKCSVIRNIFMWPMLCPPWRMFGLRFSRRCRSFRRPKFSPDTSPPMFYSPLPAPFVRKSRKTDHPSENYCSFLNFHHFSYVVRNSQISAAQRNNSLKEFFIATVRRRRLSARPWHIRCGLHPPSIVGQVPGTAKGRRAKMNVKIVGLPFFCRPVIIYPKSRSPMVRRMSHPPPPPLGGSKVNYK